MRPRPPVSRLVRSTTCCGAKRLPDRKPIRAPTAGHRQRSGLERHQDVSSDHEPVVADAVDLHHFTGDPLRGLHPLRPPPRIRRRVDPLEAVDSARRGVQTPRGRARAVRARSGHCPTAGAIRPEPLVSAAAAERSRQRDQPERPSAGRQAVAARRCREPPRLQSSATSTRRPRCEPSPVRWRPDRPRRPAPR